MYGVLLHVVNVKSLKDIEKNHVGKVILSNSVVRYLLIFIEY